MNAVTTNGTAHHAALPEEELPPPITFSVQMKSGFIWRVGSAPPQFIPAGVEPDKAMADLRITKLIEMPDGTVLAYTIPLKGSEFDRAQSGCQFTLPVDAIEFVLTVARLDTLKQMEEEAEEGEEDPEGPEEPEGPEATNGVTTDAGAPS